MNMAPWLKRFAYASAAGMFLILLMGTLVTKTESGDGCGTDWPLCNGKFIPAYTISSLIEYSHRFVTGVVGLILLVTLILVFRYSKRADAKWYVAGSMFFTVLQAILGAIAVMWPQSSAALALHFGFSLMSFAFTLLLALVFSGKGEALRRGDGSRLSRPVRLAVWGMLVFTYVVVYLGAFVRHTDSLGGCIGWPLCNGQVIPEFGGATTIVFIHRVAAMLLGLYMLMLFLAVRAQAGVQSGVYQAAKWSFVFVIMQIASGGFVTLSIGHDWYLFASLLHTLLISCLFGLMSYWGVLTWRASEQQSIKAYAAPKLP